MIEEVMKHFAGVMGERALRERTTSRDTVRITRDQPRIRTGTTSPRGDDLVITSSNFDPSNPSKRPEGWVTLRNKRVIVKEQIDRLAGVDEDTIAAMRDDRELEEEELMLAEVAQFGVVQGARQKDTASNAKASIQVTKQTFDPNVLSKRPAGWSELRMKRVMLKEHIDRLNGIDEAGIIEMRPEREIDVCFI
jgi:hypothetical protein